MTDFISRDSIELPAQRDMVAAMKCGNRIIGYIGDAVTAIWSL